MNKLGFFSITFFSILAMAMVLKARNSQENIKSPSAAQCENVRFVRGPVTIYIHGTRVNSIIPIGVSRQAMELEDRIHGGPPGLHPITEIDEKFYVRTIGTILNSVDSKQYPLENFYSFVWSGKLDPRHRYEAAHLLYDQIVERIVIPYQKEYGTPPQITIMSHSHGGNIALQLAHAGQKKPNAFTVDQLILLACPVQKETSKYITDPIFKHAFNIHSHDDMIQILDMQKFHPIQPAFQQAWSDKTFAPITCAFWKCVECPLFSERHFLNNPKLKQVRMKWDGKPLWSKQDTDLFGPLVSKVHKTTRFIARSNRGLLHIEFIIPTFFHNLPRIMHETKKDCCTEKDIILKI